MPEEKASTESALPNDNDLLASRWMLVPIAEVWVPPNRIRDEFPPEKINEIAESIAENGLIQLPVVRQDGDGLVFLVAGECRKRAIEVLYATGRTFSYLDVAIPAGAFPSPLF